MNLKEKIDRATTGAELVALAEAAKITLPDGWSKMSIDRKKRWMSTAIPAEKKPATTGLKAAATKVLTGIGKRLAKKDVALEEKIATAHAKATMPHDPKWKRRESGWRGKKRGIQFLAARAYTTPDYETASRQVRRAMDRQAGKMPLGMSAAEWHKQKGYGTINLRSRPRGKQAKAA